MQKKNPMFDARTQTITLPSEIENEIRRLIAAGNKIEAVKRVLELTGAGLYISKQYVDNLAQQK
jgi:ribosomal protein L7/L12